jgi:hypothetical protein
MDETHPLMAFNMSMLAAHLGLTAVSQLSSVTGFVRIMIMLE